jgi:pimeloyl-ACP methyl ester carboxylesterase
LHGAGGSGASVAYIAEKLAKDRNVVVIDLPGHGESDYDPGPGGTTIKACAESVLTVLDKLDLRTVDLVGIEGGACVALEMAGRYPDRTARLALVHPQQFSAEQSAQWLAAGLPSLKPDWAGGHLLRGWHMVRDSRLYFPWFQRDQAGIRWQEPELDDERMQLEVTEYLKAEGAWQELLRDQLDYPLTEKLIGCPRPIILCASFLSPWCVTAEKLAAQMDMQFLELNDDPEKWGALLVQVLSG